MEKCEFCDQEGEKADRHTANDPDKMIWLYPVEKWIHNRCFSKLSHNQPITGSVHQ